jgi:hypothetical protein
VFNLCLNVIRKIFTSRLQAEISSKIHHIIPQLSPIIIRISMSVRHISSSLQRILHSLATRVPKIMLQPVEEIYPSLKTHVVKFVSEFFLQSVCPACLHVRGMKFIAIP